MAHKRLQEPRKWLRELFEFEYCAECSGDAEHHTCILFLGNWFARCDYPPNENTGTPHPVVRKFRAEAA